MRRRKHANGNAAVQLVHDESRVLTIEVAALYLIYAIFYESLEFAQAAYLSDDTPVKEHRFNTVARFPQRSDPLNYGLNASRQKDSKRFAPVCEG